MAWWQFDSPVLGEHRHDGDTSMATNDWHFNLCWGLASDLCHKLVGTDLGVPGEGRFQDSRKASHHFWVNRSFVAEKKWSLIELPWFDKDVYLTMAFDSRPKNISSMSQPLLSSSVAVVVDHQGSGNVQRSHSHDLQRIQTWSHPSDNTDVKMNFINQQSNPAVSSKYDFTNTLDISCPWFGLHTLALVKLGHGRYDRVHLVKGTLLCWKNTHQNGSAFLPPQRVRNIFVIPLWKAFKETPNASSSISASDINSFIPQSASGNHATAGAEIPPIDSRCHFWFSWFMRNHYCHNWLVCLLFFARRQETLDGKNYCMSSVPEWHPMFSSAQDWQWRQPPEHKSTKAPYTWRATGCNSDH